MRNGRGKSSGATTTDLVDYIKTAALLLGELEQHLAMHRARLIMYEQVRSEIQAYMEARRSQFAFKTVVSKIPSDPMEVDNFGKGGKKGKKEKVMARRSSKKVNIKQKSESKQGCCLLVL